MASHFNQCHVVLDIYKCNLLPPWLADELRLIMVSSPDCCMVISYSLQQPLCVYLKQEQLMASDFLAALQRKSAAHSNRKGPEPLWVNDLSSPFRKSWSLFSFFFLFRRLNQWRVPGRTSKEGRLASFKGLEASSHQSSKLPLRWNSWAITVTQPGSLLSLSTETLLRSSTNKVSLLSFALSSYICYFVSHVFQVVDIPDCAILGKSNFSACFQTRYIICSCEHSLSSFFPRRSFVSKLALIYSE